MTNPTSTDSYMSPSLSSISIRSFQSSDHAQVAALFASGMLAYAPEGTERADKRRTYVQHCLDTDMASIQDVYIASGGHFWVATKWNVDGDEYVVGTIALLNQGDGVGELFRLSVHEDCRGCGLGRTLVRHLESWAKKHGYRRIKLMTGGEMVPAQKLYVALGYAQCEVVVEVNPYYECYVYQKDL